ncbi:porin [Polynucleobacter sp. AP-Feld-500C-C5]|uniref:porin n=1 Tax=Polynucleobacter sp. AP-Feld-500C-C5 TaxID=2576924 RepID=UPI001C0DDA9C|nr:porin [Polynucleobacter sp. AP-Feld-500C-C5]MBU3631836.1 porin [Polynucleobacter sp. AP-Feld-500C-C5]
MKKSLLALAAIGALSTAAQAQSSVTVYGILDVGYIGGGYNGTASAASTLTPNLGSTGSPIQKSQFSGMGQSAESTSRLGFKGTEDLGGGAKAFFTVELGMAPNSGTELGTVNRQSFAGLGKAGLGEASIGTQYTPVFNLQAATDAAGNNNLVGNAVYATSPQSSTGALNNVGQGGFAGAVSNQSLNASTGAYTTRASNMLFVKSERMAGIQLQASYAFTNSNQTDTSAVVYTANGGGVNNAVLVGVGADYIWNKLQVVAAYQQFKAQNNSGSATATAAASTYAAGTSNSFGNNMVDNQSYAAATYDFGILKAYLQYVNRKATSIFDGSYSTSRTAQQIGVKSQLTPVISAYATAGMGNAAYYGQSTPKNNFRTAQVGVDYYLSKRTNLYVAAGTFNQSSNGQAANTITGAGIGISGNNYAAGIRHTF